ncbi:hypothetical protein EVAR_53401_1 [Eumeta japonica]|uniref:Uncharacterized protein n=1 Tax=Eumeta variegata TaxID=151549 RepID=A0A4C1XT52_EUMVA|nr:hypothetical protein EVAR_53401_1 [Eumeta japonica]
MCMRRADCVDLAIAPASFWRQYYVTPLEGGYAKIGHAGSRRLDRTGRATRRAKNKLANELFPHEATLETLMAATRTFTDMLVFEAGHNFHYYLMLPSRPHQLRKCLNDVKRECGEEGRVAER